MVLKRCSDYVFFALLIFILLKDINDKDINKYDDFYLFKCSFRFKLIISSYNE